MTLVTVAVFGEDNLGQVVMRPSLHHLGNLDDLHMEVAAHQLLVCLRIVLLRPAMETPFFQSLHTFVATPLQPVTLHLADAGLAELR